MFIGCKVIITSGGESTAGMDSLPDEPMCMLSTVLVSTRASHSGFQYTSWKLGYPRAAGFFGRCQRVRNVLGAPSDLGRAQCGIPDDRQRHGNESSRVRAAPLIDVPVVVGLHQRQREV